MIPTTTTTQTTRRPEWFASWFDSPHYHKLYASRDEEEAARAVDALLGCLRLRPAARVLDLGCGAGRHSAYLASKGLHVTGLDLAASSIREAGKRAHRRLRFRRHDMRVPFGRRAYDCVFNFFTSFGYFTEPGEHAAVVRNMAGALRPGGVLVLDYLNARHAEARIVSDEMKAIDGVSYRLTRWSDARHFFKRIIIDTGTAEPLEYVERVAKFTLQDFEGMFARQGLVIDRMYGDYGLSAYDDVSSPRMILVARKAGMDEARYFRERLFRTRLSVSGDTPRYDASIN